MITQEEEWLPVFGYEKIYLVSSNGKVKRISTGRILKPLNNQGYFRVALCKENKPKLYSIHRLVAQAFIPNPDGLPQVNHKDENKKNNCVSNLEWCTALYNTRYGTGIKRQVEKRKGVPLSKERKQKISESCKGKKPPVHTLEGRKKMSEAAKKQWERWRNARGL